MWNGSFEPPPNERFIELMYSENERNGREQKVIVPSVEMLVRIDSDRGDYQSPDKIAFRGEAHTPNVSPSGFVPDWEGGLLSSLAPRKRSKELHSPLGLRFRVGRADFVTFHRKS